MAQAITTVDRVEWGQHPVTKEFLSQLVSSRMETVFAWGNENFVGNSMEQGALQNATALGGIRVLTDLIDQLLALQSFTEGEE